MGGRVAVTEERVYRDHGSIGGVGLGGGVCGVGEGASLVAADPVASLWWLEPGVSVGADHYVPAVGVDGGVVVVAAE